MQWHRFVNSLLFAYKEVSQESTRFAPFQLLYGRTLRGPMQILRHLWTGSDTKEEIKTGYQCFRTAGENQGHPENCAGRTRNGSISTYHIIR